jgi:hypothetical protein
MRAGSRPASGYRGYARHRLTARRVLDCGRQRRPLGLLYKGSPLCDGRLDCALVQVVHLLEGAKDNFPLACVPQPRMFRRLVSYSASWDARVFDSPLPLSLQSHEGIN